MPKTNYTFDEYLLLIKDADDDEQLRLIDEKLQEDKHNFSPYQYIDLRFAWMIKLIEANMPL